MRFLISLLLIFIGFGLSAQSDDMFKGRKKQQKRMWRKHRGNREKKNKTAFNPYLEKKAKDKPSSQIARGNKKEIRQQKRKARKQMKANKKTVKKHSKIR